MGDVSGIEISDVLGLSQPLTKLIETVSAGVGKVYEPLHVGRMAKARAKEIELISSAMGENLTLPTVYQAGNVTIDASSDINELCRRAQGRFLFQEMKKQQNIEAIIDAAYMEMKKKTAVSPEPVDSDWISEFFNNVANISDNQMQILWGKVLAGEVENPGRFSKRTLDGLKKLTKKEAEMFGNLAKFVLSCPLQFERNPKTDDYFLPASFAVTDKYHIDFPIILTLSDAGLLLCNMISAGPILPPKGIGYLYYHERPVIEFVNEREEQVELYRSAYLLTSIGKELLRVIGSPENFQNLDEYLEDCREVYLNEEFMRLRTSEEAVEGIRARVM